MVTQRKLDEVIWQNYADRNVRLVSKGRNSEGKLLYGFRSPLSATLIPLIEMPQFTTKVTVYKKEYDVNWYFVSSVHEGLKIEIPTKRVTSCDKNSIEARIKSGNGRDFGIKLEVMK